MSDEPSDLNSPATPWGSLATALRQLAVDAREGEPPEAPEGVPAELQVALGELREQVNTLRRRAEHAEQLIDRMPIGFFRNSLSDGRILYTNQANAQLFGYDSPAEAKEKMRTATNGYVNPEDREFLKEALRTEGRIDAFRTAVRHRDGHVGYVEISARIYPEEGAVEGVMVDYSQQRAREEELRAASEALRERNARLEEQQTTIDQLSLPIIEIYERTLCIPLVGALDRDRTRRLLEGVLQQVSRYQARVVLVDLTGIDQVNAETATHLISLARAVQLLGSRLILCGLRSEVARSLVTLEIDLQGIEVVATLKAALARLIRDQAKARPEP